MDDNKERDRKLRRAFVEQTPLFYVWMDSVYSVKEYGIFRISKIHASGSGVTGVYGYTPDGKSLYFVWCGKDRDSMPIEAIKFNNPFLEEDN